MTVRADLIQAVRTWLQTNDSLTDLQVIKADAKEARPPIPYLTVRLLTYDIKVGDDERRTGLDGADPVASVRGQRRGTVTVQAFGDTATEWLSDAKLALRLESIRAILFASGIAVNVIEGQGNIAAVIADQTELRASEDFDLAYTIVSANETETELLTFVFTNDLDGRSQVSTITL